MADAPFPIKNQTPYGPVLKAYIDAQVAAAVEEALAAKAAADAAEEAATAAEEAAAAADTKATAADTKASTADTKATNAGTAAEGAATAAAAAFQEATEAVAGLATKAALEHGHVIGDVQDLQDIIDFLMARGGIPTTLEDGYEDLALVYGDNQLPPPADMPNTIYVVLPTPYQPF